MSLINKVLAELEKKTTADRAQNIITANIRPRAIHSNSGLIARVIIYSFLLFMIGMVLLLHYYPKIFQEILRPELSKKQVVVTPKEIPAKPPIKLQEIQLEQRDGKSILSLILSEKAVYRSDFVAEQELVINLNAATLSGNLPVALENSFIASLNTRQNEHGVQITLLLLPGTVVEETKWLDQQVPTVQFIFANSQLNNISMSKLELPKNRDEVAFEQYQEIDNLVADGKYQEAISKLYLFLGDFPEHLQARVVLATLLIKDGKWAKAEGILDMGLKKIPDCIPLIKLKARCLNKAGVPTDAIKLLEKYILNAANDVEYLSILALLYREQGSFILAAKLYSRLTELEPQRTAWWLGLGLSLEAAGKGNGAKEAYVMGYKVSHVPPELKSFLLDKIK